MTIKYISIIFSTLASFTLSACTQLSLFAVNVPIIIPSKQVHKDIIFDKKHNLKLDIYQPKLEKLDKPLKTIVFFYGGSWKDGSKEQYKFLANEFIKRGYLILIPDYRKYPDVKFPEFMHDGAKAVSWVSENIQKYNGNPQKITLMGHSAGAHMAALLATDSSYLSNQNVNPDIIKAMIGLSGPYAFTPQSKDLKAIFGPSENYPSMRVPNFVDGTEPPMLLLHGEKDTVVGKFNLEKLEKALKAKGAAPKVIYYPDLDHTGTVASFTWVWRDKRRVDDDVFDFLAQLYQK